MYPEINTLRRASETYEKIDHTIHKPSNLEKNCNQLFTKGPALTKDFLGKIHPDLGPSRTYIFGYEMKTRHCLFLAGLLILFFTSFTGAVVMWFTSLFDKTIFSNLVLINNSQTYNEWTHVAPKPLLKLYIFNYTNIHEYETQTNQKLNVQELGPYVYQEQLDRVNNIFHEDGTLSYQEKRTYHFRPELSKGRQNDRVMVPNIPLLTGAALNRHANFFQRMAFSGLLKTLSEKPFLNMPVHRYISGYDNDFYDLSKSVLKLQNQKPVDRFGLLTRKAGIQHEIYRIGTGVDNINNLGLIQQFDGKDKFDYWSTDECNSITSSDGAMYPPKMIREKKQIQYFFRDMCRRIPLNFDSEVKILDGQIPAYKYVIPFNIFDAPEKNPANQCFCNMESGECPLQGVFNATPCNMGSPLFFSFPHFFNADPTLKTAITGLKNPKAEDIQSYAVFHPSLGFTMGGSSKFQVNIQVKKSFGISQLNMFTDDLMLPLSWFEMGLNDDNLPDSFVNILYQTTFMIKGVEYGLKYGCLLAAIVTFICLVIVLRSRWQCRERTSSLRTQFIE